VAPGGSPKRLLGENAAMPRPFGLFAAAAWVLLASLGASSTRAEPRAPLLATPHFAFYSDFDTNLNDALIAAGLARGKQQPELFRSGDETACFEKLPPSERAAWDGAVDYYQKVVSPRGFAARQQFLLRMQLVGFDAEWRQDERAIESVEIARSFRSVAAPAYRACRWNAQDEQNRKWIEELRPRLAADEARTAERLEELYRTKWKKLPLLLDVVQTVDWSGANTAWSDAGQGDILISSTVGGAAAFEIVFHESSHVLMDRDAPVQKALASAATAADFTLPGDLWHLVLFYTTGEAVRRILDERGPAGYTPMLYEIFARGSWAEFRDPLESAWRPYVDGRSTLDEAARALIAALERREPGSS